MAQTAGILFFGQVSGKCPSFGNIRSLVAAAFLKRIIFYSKDAITVLEVAQAFHKDCWPFYGAILEDDPATNVFQTKRIANF